VPLLKEIIKQTVTVDAASLTVAGAAGVGFGSFVASDFPEGNVLFLGAVSYLQFTGPTTGDLSDTWAGDYAVGTTPADDGTLGGTDVDLVASTALAAATAEVSPRTRATGATAANAAVLDNTDGSLEINVSLLVDDADIAADGIIFSVSGEIFLSYVMLGDD